MFNKLFKCVMDQLVGLIEKLLVQVNASRTEASIMHEGRRTQSDEAP